MKRIFLTTVLLLLAVSGIKAFDRGLGNPKSVFIPKGSVAVSLSGGYNNWKANGESNEQGVLLAGHVFVLLTDWEEPFKVSPPESLVDFENDPAIIGYGKVVFDKEMDKYEKFTLNIEYRSDRTPKYVAIVTSSSALGDYFTGGTGSVLYLDEFKFLY